jgi:tetratricopeptide (TPR) repeat protein
MASPPQLHQRLQDNEILYTSRKNLAQCLATEEQFYLHLLLPYDAPLFSACLSLRWMQEIEEAESLADRGQCLHDIRALDIRQRDHRWIEIEWTFPVDLFLSETQSEAVREIAGRDLNLFERFQEVFSPFAPLEKDHHQRLLEFFTHLYCLTAERISRFLLSNDLRDLHAIAAFVRDDIAELEETRSPSGFLALVFDQEISLALMEIDAMLCAGDAEDACECLLAWRNRFPQHAALLERLAKKSSLHHAHDLAIHYLEEALEDDSYYARDRLHLQLAEALYQIGKEEQALQHCALALTENPARLDALLLRAVIFLQLHQDDLAQEELSTLRCLQPAWRGLHFHEGMLAKQRGNPHQALLAFRTEVEFFSDHLEAIDAVIHTAHELGEIPLHKLYQKKRRRLRLEKERLHPSNHENEEEALPFCCPQLDPHWSLDDLDAPTAHLCEDLDSNDPPK